MFDEITRRRGDRRAARRAPYLLAAAAAEAAVLALLALLVAGGGRGAGGGSLVPVVLVRSSPPAAAPLRAPPRIWARGREEALPAQRVDRPRPPPAPPVAQAPAGAPPAHEPVAGPPAEPGAPVEQRAAGGDAGAEEPGPGPEGRAGGRADGVASRAAPGEDLPAHPAAGWRRPEQARRDCVQDSVRIPSGLRGFASGPITVKFAVDPDGTPSAFELVGEVPDARIAAALWQAIRSCRWVAGTDAEGRPARLWVIMPIRFRAG